MTSVLDIAFGGFVLSLIHVLIPNHWLPIVTLSQEEGWGIRKTLGTAALAGFFHTASTVLLGLIVGLFGYQLSRQTELLTSLIAPSLLAAIGIFLVARDYRSSHPLHNHAPLSQLKERATLLSLLVIMFFSPCLEIEAYYLVVAREGWIGIFTLSSVYLTVKILGMLILVFVGMQGVQRLQLAFLERRHGLITGLTFLGLAALSFLVH